MRLKGNIDYMYPHGDPALMLMAVFLLSSPAVNVS